MKSLGRLGRGRILKRTLYEYFESLCCVKGGIIVHKNMHFHSCLCYFSFKTHLWLSAVYIFLFTSLFFGTEVTLLVLLLQYLSGHTVCGCCWEPEAFVQGCVDLWSCKMSSSVMLFNIVKIVILLLILLYTSAHSETVTLLFEIIHCFVVCFCSFFCICVLLSGQ